jgi:hypothetical protein
LSDARALSAASIWRAAAIGLLGLAIGLTVMTGANAGSGDVKVLSKTKVAVSDGSVPGGAGQDSTTIAKCPKGYLATGGGIDFQSTDPAVTVPYNGPLVENDNLVAAGAGTFKGGRKWRVRVENDSAGSYTYSVGAVCSKLVTASK